jgi:hypothetical protein
MTNGLRPTSRQLHFLEQGLQDNIIFNSQRKCLMANGQPHYDVHDYGVMASNVFYELCEIDKDDRREGRPPTWHDISELVKKLSVYLNKVDVASITKAIVLWENGFVELDPRENNIKLTELGRQNCDKGIEVPQSKSPDSS